MIVRAGENQNYPFKGRKVRGFSFIPRLTSTAPAVPQVIGDYNAKGCFVKLQLTRRNSKGAQQKHVIFTENLRTLAAETALRNSLEEFVLPSSTTKFDEKLVVQGLGVAEVAIRPMLVDLGTVIDLRNDDVLELTVNSGGNEYSSAIDTATSFLEVQIYEGEGEELAIPQIISDSVTTNESNNTYNPGDNTVSVCFINLDKTDKLTASQVLQSVNITSSRLSINDSWNEVQAKNAQRMASSEFNILGQSAVLMHGNIIQQAVKVDLQFISANVTGGNNYVVSRKMISSPEIFQQGMKNVAAVKAVNEQKLMGGN